MLAKKIITIIFIISVAAMVFWIFVKNKDAENVEVVQDVKNVQDDESFENVRDVEVVEDVESVEIVQDDKNVQFGENVILDVPFVLQAPFGNWSDPLFEDACEEAAILMTDGWLNEKTFTAQLAYDEIINIAELEEKILGETIDASAEDTAEILKKYTNSLNVKVAKNISKEDLIAEVLSNNLVIAPTNGRKLMNPNYTAPGPITHMIVIIGYDEDENEFITNDSGTRKGKGYRYPENVLFDAIRDYPTGNHYLNPVDEKNPKKNIIIIKK